MLDRYWDGRVDRISPEAPVPILHVRREFSRAGGAANVALNLVDLGSRVRLATLLGQDEAGDALARLMADHGIELGAVRDMNLCTTQKIRSVCKRHQLLRIDFEEQPPAGSVEALLALITPMLADHDWVVFSDYAKGCLARCEEMMSRALRQGCKVLVDPKGRDFSIYRGAFMLKPNAEEVREVVGEWGDEDEFLAKARSLREKLDVEHLLVTRGELGMTLCSRGKPCINLPTQVREVYDVSGAGDTALAAVAHFLSEGLAIEDAVRWANKAAGIVVGKFGTASVTREELGLPSREMAA
jgi:rfaE bifunctional protein kinase chain/domain